MYMTDHLKRAAQSAQSFMDFHDTSAWGQRHLQPGVADLVLGNPHEMPLPGMVDSLQKWSVPLNKDWFAYKLSEPDAQSAAAEGLRARTAVAFQPEDIALTTGAFGALSTAMHALLEPGDEVIYFSPPWPFYEPIVHSARGVPVKLGIDPDTFDIDLAALDAAITPRTRMVLVNTPNNPTGRIYPPAVLEEMAEILTAHSTKNGRAILLLSDEPYARIVFDGRRPVSPASFYPNTLISYSYGKITLAPGQRIGYLATSPGMENREELHDTIRLCQITLGWAFPNALLQHALPDIEQLSIDVPHLQEKRDWMLSELRAMGYEAHTPEATFYLMPRSPISDDMRFIEMLAEHDVFVLPGTVFEMPGCFRISLTANDEMIERALPAFKAVMERISGARVPQAV